MHVNPIKSKPLSLEGRENYDRIFRKKPVERFYDTLDAHLDAIRDKQMERAREAEYEMTRQKHIDESA